MTEGGKKLKETDFDDHLAVKIECFSFGICILYIPKVHCNEICTGDLYQC